MDVQDVCASSVKSQSKCSDLEMIPGKSKIKKGFSTNAALGMLYSQRAPSQHLHRFFFFLSYSLMDHPAEAFNSKGLKELYKYSTQGFALLIGEMQPLTGWEAPSPIRGSQGGRTAPLQDGNAVKGRDLTEIKQKINFFRRLLSMWQGIFHDHAWAGA